MTASNTSAQHPGPPAESLQADVIVVGGGIVGTALASWLAEAGRRVVLFERRVPASGASGRNGGMVMQVDGRDSDAEAILLRLRYAHANMALLKALPERSGIDLELRHCGSLDVATTEEEVELLRGLAKFQHEIGDEEIEFLDRKGMRRVTPVMSELALAARFRPSDGWINPFFLVRAYARIALRHGARIVSHAPVDEIVFDGEEAVGVRIGDVVHRAPIVVNATNGWARYLTPAMPVIPLRSLAILTEPVPPVPALTFEAELWGQVVYGATQTGSGNLLVGGPPEVAADIAGQFEEYPTFFETVLSSKVLTTLFPAFGRLSIIRAWSGAMGITPDGLPAVGPVPGARGLYICAGFPNGMAFTSIMARLTAEAVLGRDPTLPLGPYDAKRFAGVRVNWPERYNYTVLADFLARR